LGPQINFWISKSALELITKEQTWRAFTEDRRCTMNRSNTPSQHAIRQTAEQPPDLDAPPKCTDQVAAQRTADRPQENLRGVGPISMGSQSIGSCLEGAEPSSRAAVLENPRPSKRKRPNSRKKTSQEARWTYQFPLPSKHVLVPKYRFSSSLPVRVRADETRFPTQFWFFI
jgi:hypothetical protein